MHLDPRIPLGWMFTMAGGILVFFGFATSGQTSLYAPSLGINANLWCGLPLLAFGLILFVQGQRAQKLIDKEAEAAAKPGSRR